MISSSLPEDKLILSLDQMSESEVISLLDKLPNLIWVKVGLELFTLKGPEIVFKLRDLGKKVFLDLKFHDIPNTMGRACYIAAKTGVDLMTVHACAGKIALEKANQSAIKGAKEVGLQPPGLLAVTVLTSWRQEDFVNQLCISHPLADRANLLADLACSAGLAGCICSPLEVRALRNLSSESFELVTPGIRSKGFDRGDQSRVMTPSEAIKAGASKIVLGRSVTLSKNPVNAFNGFCTELENLN